MDKGGGVGPKTQEIWEAPNSYPNHFWSFEVCLQGFRVKSGLSCVIGPFGCARAGCYSQAELSSNDSKTLLYVVTMTQMGSKITASASDSDYTCRNVVL